MKVIRAEGLAWRKIEDETVVIHLSERKMFGLNHVGGMMWEALGSPTTIEALGEVAHIPDAGDENLINAVRAFISDLADEGLVTMDEPPDRKGAGAEIVDFEAPKIEWREEILQFAGQCQFLAGQSLQCNQQPGGS